jgi:hypothetical protein
MYNGYCAGLHNKKIGGCTFSTTNNDIKVGLMAN